MESTDQAIVTSSPPMDSTPEIESHLSSLLFDLSQQVQGAMEDLLKMINEIDANSVEVSEEMEKCKESALSRRKTIEEERERFQKAAFAVLDVLNMGEGKQSKAAYDPLNVPYRSLFGDIKVVSRKCISNSSR